MQKLNGNILLISSIAIEYAYFILIRQKVYSLQVRLRLGASQWESLVYKLMKLSCTIYVQE